MPESNAVAPLNQAALDFPQTWDRQGDVVMAFAAGLEARWRIATMLAKSGMTRESRPEAIMAIMLKAFEMGLPLMQALSGMYFVDGKIAIEGHLLDALAIQRCGVSKTIHEATRTRCAMTLHRKGWDDVPAEYSLTDAKTAGLIKDFDSTTLAVTPAVSRSGKPQLTWTKHTEEMLYWRALSKGLKRIAPDYFGGTYTLEELEQTAEAQVVTSGNRSTMEELKAVVEKYGGGTAPVEPDPATMELDEIERLRTEANNAKLAGIIDADLKNDALDAAARGEWQRARDLWDAIRAAVLHAESGRVQQGALL